MRWFTIEILDKLDKGFIGAHYVPEFSFDTEIDGGYGAGTFFIATKYFENVALYRRYFNKILVLYSDYGDRIYEGRVEDVSITMTGVKIQTLGLYSHANDLLHGLVYPTSTPTSISEVIEDTIDLADLWSTDKYFVHQTTTDITPLDFTGEAKLRDAIVEVIKFGSDDVPPRPLHFQVWNNAICHLVAEPSLEQKTADVIIKTDFRRFGDVQATLSRSNIFNKIQAIYDDPVVGQDFTSFYEDADSQLKYGIREGTINVGQVPASIAGLVAELALEAYKYPEQATSISLPVYSSWSTRSRLPIYYVKAGDLIRIDDVDPSVSELIGGSFGSEGSALTVVQKTSYSYPQDTMTITPGARNQTFDILLAQLGISVGGVR